MLAACWRRKSRQLGAERRGAGVNPAASSSRRTVLGETRAPSFSSSPQSEGSPTVDSRARTAGRAVAPDPRPPDGPDAAGAASTSDARVPDARADASGASPSTHLGADAGATGPAPRGRHDRLLPTRGASAGARARRADVVTRAVPRPWRTRCSGFERATAERLRTRDRRRTRASADAPRAHDRRQQDPEPWFWNPSGPRRAAVRLPGCA